MPTTPMTEKVPYSALPLASPPAHSPAAFPAPRGSPEQQHHRRSSSSWGPTQGDSASAESGSSESGRRPLSGRFIPGEAGAVARGEIGSGLGPYAPNMPSSTGLQHNFASTTHYQPTRFSAFPSTYSLYVPASASPNQRYSRFSMLSDAPSSVFLPPTKQGERPYSYAPGGIFWDSADEDDVLHNPEPAKDQIKDRRCDPLSGRGWMNVGAVTLLLAALITLFAGYPVIQYYTRAKATNLGAYGLGGTNGTGQIPDIPGVPTLIDRATPKSAYTRTGFDKKEYTLVFSDEFETEGRTFWPGDDPYWEAVNFWYWPTGDLEWYSPENIFTKDGYLQIRIDETRVDDLDYKSGMLQSWNKFCFTGGYVEFSISLPGSGEVSGLWPGAWTMGNLGRPGYGATTEGLWPYSYDSCDVGTLSNQTNPDGDGPAAALEPNSYGGSLSMLRGQRVSACTCKGEDHPGPSPNIGRGAPEIDALEAQVEQAYGQGAASQSAQFAPFDAGYWFHNSSSDIEIYDSDMSFRNSYQGGSYQESVSVVSLLGTKNYELGSGTFQTYGFEYFSDPKERDNGYITWAVGDKPTWTMHASTVRANPLTEIDRRLVSEEPMSIIMNLGISQGFAAVEFDKLRFPATMKVDYVRVYQHKGKTNIGCDPPDYPTWDYISRHPEAYNNANWTTWNQAGYSWPKNSLVDHC